MAKNRDIKISNPDDFNKHLQHTSLVTWIVLGLIIAILVSLFVWSFLYKVTIKLMGKADVVGGEVTLHVKDSDLNKLQVGQKVYIEGKIGEIISFNDDQPKVSNFALSDGEYTYAIHLKQTRPIDFLLNK